MPLRRRYFTVVHHGMLVVCATFSLTAAAGDICVFTNRQHPLAPAPGIRVVDLDVPAQLEAELSQPLPADPQRAAAVAQARLQRCGSDLQRRLAAAYSGVIEAWRLGVAKLPAVVVDQRYVVYGDIDVAHAAARIATFRDAPR